MTDEPTPNESADSRAPQEAPAVVEGERLSNVSDNSSSTSVEQPRVLPILPLRTDVAFPGVIMPLMVGRDKGVLLVEDVFRGDKLLALATQTSADHEDPSINQLHKAVCVAQVLKILRFPDGSTRIVAQGLRRGVLGTLISAEPYLKANVLPMPEEHAPGEMVTSALLMAVRQQLQKLIEGGGAIPEELQVAALNTSEPHALADLLASGLPFSTKEKLQLLEEPVVRKRLKTLSKLLRRQVGMQTISSRIQGEATSELTRSQREQFLRQQLEAIRRELGDEEETSDVQEFARRLSESKLPDSAAREARRELDRMAQMHPSSPEYHVIRSFLDTLLSMPWNIESEDRLDIKRARRILDDDHFDLDKIKQRILEFLSVRKLKQDMKGPILCFVGPPGVGKTSLGKSIARTMGRKFIRISLGGVHDEAEIRGHRRTYIGAMPGRIIQGIRRMGTRNPVFMLDEIDKIGSDYRGDPSSALLEVLDPEQNSTFRDHYFDVEFDLSRVLFICTANNTQTIPAPLLDRMEVIELTGYSEEEKIAIAHRYLIKKQLQEHGLPARSATFTPDGLRAILRSYTHEAGLRNFEREIASICRKIARAHAEGNRRAVRVDAKKAMSYLGPARYLPEAPELTHVPGSANGLAWTPAGGERLTIESIKAPGPKHGLKLTGSLGDVMKESAHAALGYLRGHVDQLGIPSSFFEDYEIHIHVPAGAISKDGPSAGVAITASLLSLARQQPLRAGLAMTGEITLTGRVLAVGGIREKLLAARRERLNTVILPYQNEKDTEELPPEVRADLKFIFVRRMDDVIPHLFETPSGKANLSRNRIGKRGSSLRVRKPSPLPPPTTA